MDVTGLPVGALVVPASTHENVTTELMLEHLSAQSGKERLELVLVDRGVTSPAATRRGRHHGLEVRRVGWDNKPTFRPIRHAWRVEVAHGRLGPSRPARQVIREHHLVTSWLQVAFVATSLRHLSRHRTQHPAPQAA